MKKILSYFFAAFLLLSAIGHAITPEFYAPMIPDLIPEMPANILATILESIIAIMLIIPKYRSKGGLAFMILMLLFLPIHIWDLFREDPAIGEAPLPALRVGFQFIMIYCGWWIYKSSKPGGSRIDLDRA